MDIQNFPFQGLYLAYREGNTVTTCRPSPDLSEAELAQARKLVEHLAKAQDHKTKNSE